MLCTRTRKMLKISTKQASDCDEKDEDDFEGERFRAIEVLRVRLVFMQPLVIYSTRAITPKMRVPVRKK